MCVCVCVCMCACVCARAFLWVAWPDKLLEESIPRHEIFLRYLDPTSTKRSLCTASNPGQRSQQKQNNIFNSSGGFPEANLGIKRANCSTAKMAMFVFEEDLAGDRLL